MAAAPDRARQAFRILHLGFIVAPILAGLDKFFEVLVDWDRYLAPVATDVLPVSGHTIMLAVGVVEIIAGLVVLVSPRFGGLLVAAWLAGIIFNLLLVGGYGDIALREYAIIHSVSAKARIVAADEHETTGTRALLNLGHTFGHAL